MRKKKNILFLLIAFLLTLSFQAYAFEDVTGTEEGKIISELQSKRIISGVDAKRFLPNRPLTYAEAATLFVRAFSLTMPDFKWVKEPKASDMYKQVPDQTWFSKPFMILFYNQISFPADVKPMEKMSREEFAYYLHRVLVKVKNPIVIQMWVEYADLDQVNKGYQGAINDLINLKVVTLDAHKKFHPKEPVTRLEAALMIYRAMQVPDGINGGEPMPPVDQKPEPVQLKTESVNEDVYKVTLIWGEKPNPGYRITIDQIQFDGKTAYLYYSLHYPDPNKFYPQVITEVKTSTYVSKEYQIETRQSRYGVGPGPGEPIHKLPPSSVPPVQK